MQYKFRVILGLGFITNLKGLLKHYRPSTSFCSGRAPNDLCFDQSSLFPVLYMSFGQLYFQVCYSAVVFKQSPAWNVFYRKPPENTPFKKNMKTYS